MSPRARECNPRSGIGEPVLKKAPLGEAGDVICHFMYLSSDISVIPSDTWGGEGLLGLVIRHDTVKGADEYCMHVLVRTFSHCSRRSPSGMRLTFFARFIILQQPKYLQEVFDKSPAQKAGLIPHEDYLLGTHDIVLKSMDDLQYLISKYTNQVAIVHVYNTFNKNVREVGHCFGTVLRVNPGPLAPGVRSLTWCFHEARLCVSLECRRR